MIKINMLSSNLNFMMLTDLYYLLMNNIDTQKKYHYLILD